MTAQEVYNRVRKHLLTQRRRAMSPAGDCLYRAPDGACCAVGCLIPDSVYDETLENNSVSARNVLAALYRAGFTSGEIGRDEETGEVTGHLGRLLSNLQSIHDYYPVAEWEEALDKLAESLGLEVQA